MRQPTGCSLLFVLLLPACAAEPAPPELGPELPPPADLAPWDQAPPADLAQTQPDLVCAAPRALCSGVCVDTLVDNGNCGGCGRLCFGVPQIQATCCGGACVALQENPQHCGACGRSCPPNKDCIAGKCQQ